MIYKTIFKSSFLAFISATLVGCATANKELNMYHKTNLLQDNDNNLVKSSIKLSNSLNENDNTVKDESYNAYPNKILKKLLNDDNLHFSKNVKFNVKVIKNPTINAFALPNGSIYIHSGLLAKIENEAQLALLIGHEMNHVIYKHGLKQSENHKSGAAVAQIFGILTSPFDAGLLSALLFNSSISGYSQKHETEADIEGYAQIVNAGYDPVEASKLFDIMLNDIKLNKIKQPYFFSTHPRVEERIKNSKDIIKEKYQNISGIVNKKEYQEYVQPILIENIKLDLKLRRFESAEFSINTLKTRAYDLGYVNFFKAELLRLQKKDYDKALENYNLALEKNINETYKGIAYLYFQQNKYKKAKEAFENYLSFNKNAKDTSYIKHYINLCDKKEKNEKTN